MAGGESDWDEKSHYVNPKTGDDSYGLFQINLKGSLKAERMARYHLSKPEDLYDPVTNAKAAYDLWLYQGRKSWSPWGAFKDGGYKRYGRYEKAQAAVASLQAKQPEGDPVRPAYANSPNRSSGLTPQGIVVHRTYGSYSSAVSWFQDPSANASAHFVVGQDGTAVQMVPLPTPDDFGRRDGAYKAWHVKSMNGFYVGIEHEGTDTDPPSDKMLETSAAISRMVCDLYSIPKRFGPSSLEAREQYRGLGAHANMPANDHTDGNPWPWKKYLALINQQGGPLMALTDQEQKQLLENVNHIYNFMHNLDSAGLLQAVKEILKDHTTGTPSP